jgi:hypothetical protein
LWDYRSRIKEPEEYNCGTAGVGLKSRKNKIVGLQE